MKRRISFITVPAMLVGLSFVLSNIKLLSMPSGGSVTAFSMLVISLPGYLYGFPTACISSIVYGLLQFIYGRYMYSVPQVILDYILAFGSFAVVGLFKEKKHGLIIGFTIACILRFIFSTMSGVIFFADYAPKNMNPIVYSAIYNAGYIFTEMLLSYIIILLPVTKKLLNIIKKL